MDSAPGVLGIGRRRLGGSTSARSATREDAAAVAVKARSAAGGGITDCVLQELQVKSCSARPGCDARVQSGMPRSTRQDVGVRVACPGGCRILTGAACRRHDEMQEGRKGGAEAAGGGNAD